MTKETALAIRQEWFESQGTKAQGTIKLTANLMRKYKVKAREIFRILGMDR